MKAVIVKNISVVFDVEDETQEEVLSGLNFINLALQEAPRRLGAQLVYITEGEGKIEYDFENEEYSYEEVDDEE